MLIALEIAVGLIAIIIFGPFILRLLYTNGYYLLWRLGGGVKKALEYAESKTLWEAFELSDPCPMTADVNRDFFVSSISTKDAGNGHEFVTVDKRIVLSLTQGVEGRDKISPALQVKFSKVFPVNPRRVAHGCHGHYSLAKALFFIQNFGGDPTCGGGIKHFWPPRWQDFLELRRLRRILYRKETINAFVWECQSETHGEFSGNIYKYSDREALGYIDVLIGDSDMVERYAKEINRKVKQIELVFA